MKTTLYVIIIALTTTVIIWALYNIGFTENFLATAWTKWVEFTMWLKNLLGLAV